MDLINLSAILISMAACFMYLNFRYIKLPMTIGLALLSLLFSVILLVAGRFSPLVGNAILSYSSGIDFNVTLMHGMLSFLLFAGSLHVNLDDLYSQGALISVLATIGVVTSTFLFGSAFYGLAKVLGMDIDYIYCLLFGSLISPTDPISVLGILKEAKAPKSLETKICGESLFNDGVGVVVFIVILQLAVGSGTLSPFSIVLLFFEEALGGVVFGLLLGWTFYKLLKSVDDYALEIMLTISLVMGGYSLATYFHLSGPLAMVVAGLFIGNHGKRFAMSDATHTKLFSFWELVDEFLNAVLFVLIGIVILQVSIEITFVIAGIISIPLVLLVRFISISIPIKFFKIKKTFTNGIEKIMTWGGLRGGISIALALSLPDSIPSETKNLILTATYLIVIFSIVVQGLTIKSLIQKNIS